MEDEPSRYRRCHERSVLIEEDSEVPILWCGEVNYIVCGLCGRRKLAHVFGASVTMSSFLQR